jgi:CBS domain-containing protein
VVDEIANAAFFTGLMLGVPQAYGEIATHMGFDDAKLNFFRAARHGLDAQFQWIDGQSHNAVMLILDQLLPLARRGLSDARVSSEDIDKYLGIIEERARGGQTGARWIMKSLAAIGSSASKDATQRRLTSEILANQKQSQPVHRWPVIEKLGADEWEHGYRTVGQFMSTDLFTVSPDDLIDLAASVMDWRHIRHVPVEDQEGRLVGLITHRGLLRMMINSSTKLTTVREIMVPDPVTVSPSTSSLEAMELMRNHRVGCLPVVEGDQLVGIITSYDFLEATARLFEQRLSEEPKSRSQVSGA